MLERFFDESGGMQLVLHAPFGSRVNKAWALALRKRFCRQFNFELQAAATEDALLLSLGPQHSFPLADVFRYLHPASVRDILVQAFLDAPVFQTRWRWNATISLAVPRNRGGRKVAPQLQRMQADDLMAAVFPDAAACLENIPGRSPGSGSSAGQPDRTRLPRGSDGPGAAPGRPRPHSPRRGDMRLARHAGALGVLHDIVNARPYAFVDDAPLEERRTQAVQTRRAGGTGHDIGALDRSAIDRVRDEVRPDPRDADELHDALLIVRFSARRGSSTATCARRLSACWPRHPGATRPEARPSGPGSGLPPNGSRSCWPSILMPRSSRRSCRLRSRAARVWTREDALVELLRGRMSHRRPRRGGGACRERGGRPADIDAALADARIGRRRPARRRSRRARAASNGATGGCSPASIATR